MTEERCKAFHQLYRDCICSYPHKHHITKHIESLRNFAKIAEPDIQTLFNNYCDQLEQDTERTNPYA